MYVELENSQINYSDNFEDQNLDSNLFRSKEGQCCVTYCKHTLGLNGKEKRQCKRECKSEGCDNFKDRKNAEMKASSIPPTTDTQKDSGDDSESGGSNKAILIIIPLIIVVVFAIIFFMKKNKTKN